MGSQNTVVYDLQPAPRRPGTDDVGGFAKQDTTQPADPVTGLRASDWNQIAQLITKACKMTPLLIVCVRYSGGNPVIDSIACPSGNVAIGAGAYQVNIARTGGGAGSGDVTITWTAGALPSLGTSQPWWCVLNDLLGSNRAPSAQAVANGVRVVTTNGAGAATDIAFTVAIG